MNQQGQSTGRHGKQAIQCKGLPAILEPDFRAEVPRNGDGVVARHVIHDADTHFQSIGGALDGTQAMFEKVLAIPGGYTDEKFMPHV